jgi:hypothetical protein
MEKRKICTRTFAGASSTFSTSKIFQRPNTSFTVVGDNMMEVVRWRKYFSLSLAAALQDDGFAGLDPLHYLAWWKSEKDVDVSLEDVAIRGKDLWFIFENLK